MSAGDNKCDRCGQWSGPGHVCPTGNIENAGGTALLSRDDDGASAAADVPTTVAGLRRVMQPGAVVTMTNHWGLVGVEPGSAIDRTVTQAATNHVFLSVPGRNPSRMDFPRGSDIHPGPDGATIMATRWTPDKGEHQAPFVTIHAIRAPGEDVPTPADNLATLRALPAYTEVDVHYEDQGHEHTNRLMARGIPMGENSGFCRRFTDLTYGTEMHFGERISDVPVALHPMRIEVDESTLPHCSECGAGRAGLDGSRCQDCEDESTCATCGDELDLDGWDGECGNCADLASVR